MPTKEMVTPMLRILFTTPLLEHPPAGGPALRIENSIKALHRISELHLLVRVNQATIGGPEAENFFRGQCHTLAYSPSVFGETEIKDAEFIINYANAQQIDLIWFGYGNISFSLMKQIKRRRPELKIVCDTDSVWSRFILRELPYEPSAERRAQIQQSGFQKQQEEAEWVNFCDVTTAVSEVDADYYRGLAADPSRIHLFSNVIDPATYSERPPRPPELHKPCLYLAGSFYADTSPMARAARWMLDDILPRVRQIIPDIHFYIVGKGSREIFGHIQSPHITVTGQLPSVLPYLTHADVALVPLMFESGTRFKIMEAGICGVPLVSTTLGAEGLPVTHGQELLIADEPDAFAAAIIQLVQNKPLAQRLAANCRQLITKFCSIDWLVQEATTIVQFLMAEQPAVQPPPHIEVWLELGKRHYHLGQYEQALLQFQQVVDLEPKNAKAWSAVAQIAQQLNDQRTYAAASTLVRQATMLDRQAAAAWLAEVGQSWAINPQIRRSNPK